MASDPSYFSRPNNPDDLKPLFAAIARQVLTNAARLVDNDNPDLVE
jgi:hypothetical protein